MTRAIYFDMDGTIADLYGVEGWLSYLLDEEAKPYKEAKPMCNMQVLARKLNQLQMQGYHIGVVSWLSKGGSAQYHECIREAKMQWLSRHLRSVKWNEIKIIEYGVSKSTVVEYPNGILFDDEAPNREAWRGNAYDANKILEILKSL